MTPEEIRAVMERYAKLMCDSDADAIAALYSEDCFVEDPVGGNPIQGIEAVRGFYAATSPNLQVEVTGPICVAGNHCAMPLHKELGLVASARASIACYNTKEEVDALIDGIKETQKIFK